MGSDLFGSFAESTCAALVIGSSIGLSGGWDALVFPVVVSAVGIFVCLVCSFIATHIKTVKQESHVEEALKIQLISTTVLMIPSIYYTAEYFLPAAFTIAKTVGKDTLDLAPWQATVCVSMGAVGGLIIGLITVSEVGVLGLGSKRGAFSYIFHSLAGILHEPLVSAGP